MVEADRAMALLLDTDAPERLDPQDLVRALDAMERLGPDGQAWMFQSFIEFAVARADRALPPLVHQITTRPLAWAGRLSAAVLREALEHGPAEPALALAPSALPALIEAVSRAALTDPPRGAEAIGALAAWARHAAVPGAATAAGAWLEAAERGGRAPAYAIEQARALMG